MKGTTTIYKTTIGIVDYDADLCYEKTFKFETKEELMAFREGLDWAIEYDAWFYLDNSEDKDLWDGINIEKQKLKS